MAYMPAASKEFLHVPHTDPDANEHPVEIAIILKTAGEPSDSDYHAAAWDGQEAVLLIGAGSDLELAPGEYAVWTRLTTPSQRPVRLAGLLTVGAT